MAAAFVPSDRLTVELRASKGRACQRGLDPALSAAPVTLVIAEAYTGGRRDLAARIAVSG